jgi:signal transduction histidine kinase
MITSRFARRPLQKRLALAYAAGIYVAGVFVLACVDLPLARVNAAVDPSSGAVHDTGPGISLPQLLLGSAAALVVLVPVALALGWVVAGRFLLPLQNITATARIISAHDLHRRVDLGEPTDELTDLGHTLDDLFARLQDSFNAQRHFIANVSHELRTPLTGLRTLLEVALADPDADAAGLRAACQEALELSGRQERLVQALLALASGERGPARWNKFDLTELVDGVLAARRNQAADMDVTLTERLAPANVTGDSRLIESLVVNLIDNAIRHNSAGGHVEVAITSTDLVVVLTVGNSGPVIPDDQIPRLFQPFQKLAPDRHGDGWGLGLAIVEAVARANFANVDVRARPEGGLSVTVRFSGESVIVRIGDAWGGAATY